MVECFVPISIGELFDKYTILQIKSEKIVDEKNLQCVNTELSYLKEHIIKYNVDYVMIDELKQINELLWDIEDRIRIKEQKQ